MNELLELMVDENASDLHIHVGQPPCFRINGTITPADGPALTPKDTEELVDAIASEHHIQKIKTVGGADFGFAFRDRARFRVNAFKAKGSFEIVLRQIPNDILTLGQVGLPDKMKDLLMRPRGLFLVTGPTGSGKSTTLASMIDWIRPGSLMRATPPCTRISAGTRSSAITATAPASSAILACSGVTTSMITPPFSICARPRLSVSVPFWAPLFDVGLSAIMFSP